MREPKSIAIVDDHTLLRRGLVTLINLFSSYKVVLEASDGKDFIAQLKPAHYPDIVLLDINMPNMNGYETAAWLTANHPDIKILSLSLLEPVASIKQMIQLGARGAIRKDADPSELKQAFDEVLKKGYYSGNDDFNRVYAPTLSQMDAITQQDKDSFAKLTGQELAFLKLVCTELTYREIATKMFLSNGEIDAYRDTLFAKLDVKTRVGLVMYAIRNKIFIP